MAERRIGEKIMRLIRGDITDLDIEAFVHDITEDLKLGAGFGSAIQQRGGVAIQKELNAIGRCPVGEAVITNAGLLKAKHIIHVNGPKFREDDEEGKLRRATKAALRRAEEKGIARLAFPSLGTGFYQVPLALCARVMVSTVAEHLQDNVSLQEVLFVVSDSREYRPFEAAIMEGV